MSKVIFLDIDGVMNCRESCARYGTLEIFSEEAVEALNSILRESGARIVISSSWRQMHRADEMEKILVWHGVDAKNKVLGDTPIWNLSSRGNILGGFESRGDEIYNWLENYEGKVNGICILDDNLDMMYMMPWLLLTDANVGLKRYDVSRAVSMLNTPFDLENSVSKPDVRLPLVGSFSFENRRILNSPCHNHNS